MKKFYNNLVLLWILSVVSFIVYNNRNITIGPNDKLILLGIVINTYWKYGILVCFCIINSVIRSLNQNVLNPYILQIQECSDSDNHNHRVAYEIATISTIYIWFDWFLYINILLSQIDMVFIEIFSDLIVINVIIYYCLNHRNNNLEYTEL